MDEKKAWLAFCRDFPATFFCTVLSAFWAFDAYLLTNCFSIEAVVLASEFVAGIIAVLHLLLLRESEKKVV